MVKASAASLFFCYFLNRFFFHWSSDMAATGSTEGLPLEDRSNDLKIPIITLIVFSSIFVILRLYISWRNRNFFQLTDHFLWTGHVGFAMLTNSYQLTYM